MITLRFRDSVVYLTSFVKQQASEKECDPHETFLSQHQTHPSADPGHPAHHSPGRLRRVQHPGSLHRHRRAGCLRPDQRRDGQDAHRAQNPGGLFLRHRPHQSRGRDPVEDPCLPTCSSWSLRSRTPTPTWTGTTRTAAAPKSTRTTPSAPPSRPSSPTLDDYDTILLGYPLWWGDAPLIVRTFLESGDFGGKTIIPFCTSSSSGFGDSGKHLEAFAPGAAWQDGMRFSSNTDEQDVADWANSLF